MEAASIAISGFLTKPSIWTEIIIVHQRKGRAMGDLVDRQAAIDVIEAGRLTKLIDAETAVNGLKALPPAQPDIVVCGDCIHWICHDKRCGYWNHGVKPLDWCCHAERRTDE